MNVQLTSPVIAVPSLAFAAALTVATYCVVGSSAPDGVKRRGAARRVVGDRAPATASPAALRSVTLAVVSVDGSMARSNVALTVAAPETPVAPSAGPVEATCGGVPAPVVNVQVTSAASGADQLATPPVPPLRRRV